jgi:type I restriction enzyme S subunit
MVPNGWESKPLVKLLDRIIDYRGQSVPKASFGIPLITARNVRDGYLDFSSQEYVDESKFEAWMSRGVPSKGDILFTTEAPLGKACRYPTKGQFAVGQRTVTLRTNNQLDSEFLLYTLLSERGQRLIDIRSSGSTAKGIKSSELKKVKISYPESLSEQRKIAKILSTWDKAITTTEKLIETSKQQKKALMQQLLTGKKRLVNPETGKVYEGEWEDKYLNDFSKVIVSPVDKKTVEGEIPVELCNYTDVYYNTNITQKLTFMKATAKQSEIDKFTLEVDDVIITKDSETPGDIAVPALVSEDLNGVVCGYHLAIVRTDKQQADGAFINYLFSMPKTRYYFFTLATGATRFGLSIGGINKAHFCLPPLSEQQKIASVLTAADKEIEVLEAKLSHFKQEKKALMQQLLTGKRRVSLSS